VMARFGATIIRTRRRGRLLSEIITGVKTARIGWGGLRRPLLLRLHSRIGRAISLLRIVLRGLRLIRLLRRLRLIDWLSRTLRSSRWRRVRLKTRCVRILIGRQPTVTRCGRRLLRSIALVLWSGTIALLRLLSPLRMRCRRLRHGCLRCGLALLRPLRLRILRLGQRTDGKPPGLLTIETVQRHRRNPSNQNAAFRRAFC
jgi:hypothetical protein